MNKKKFTKLLVLYLPYVVIGLLATNLGEAWRLTTGKELGDKILSLMSTVLAAFANPLPSLHPFDLFVGLCCGAWMRLAVYLKGKNAKKYRHGMEYGSARWGTAKDIEPFMAPKFEDNIILTKTERLMMSNRPTDPKNARNKNVLIVGGAGSGKSTLVQTILYALCTRQTPEQLNWYALDCSNHRLDALRATAHCGAIVYPEEEEKVSRLFSQLTELLQTRRRALADASAADAEVFRASGAGLMPLTLVVIDNYAGFMESCERFAEPLLKILRDGMACGIQFIVTMNTPMDIRSRWSQCFATAIPLMLTERADYYNYLGTTPQMMPTGEPGSGLTVYNGSIVQFQSAYVSDLATYTALARPSQTGYRAPQLRYIDKQELYAAYLRQEAVRALPADTLPLGWYTRSIRPYALRLWQTFCYFISDVSGAGARAAEANILRCAAEKQLECHIVCASAAAEPDPQFRYYSGYEEVLSLMTYLRDLFKRRATAKREYIAANGADGCEAYLRKMFRPVLVLFEDYNAFCAMSYSPGTRVSYTDVWETLLKNGRGYGVTFLAVWNRALYQQSFQKQAVQLFLSYQTGVHLGGKLDAQRAIETGLSITEQARVRPPETGFALEGTRLSEVYLPRAAAPAEEL